MINYTRIAFLLFLCFLAHLSACGGKASLSDKMAVSVIKEQILEEAYNIGVPIGFTYFNYNFKPSNIRGKDLNYENHPRRLEHAKILADNGLLQISLIDKQKHSSSNLKEYDISLTSKGHKKLWRKDQGMAYFKLAKFKNDRIVNNTLIKDDKTNNAEPKRLVMFETVVKQTKLGNEVLGEVYEDGQVNKLRIRAILKYDNFDNKWYVLTLDVADEEGNWKSNNAEF